MKHDTELIFDLHSHILPVDDGAGDLGEAIATLQSSYEQGIRYVFATPHSFAFNINAQRVEQTFDKLCDIVSKTLPDIHLEFGCEILCSKDRMGDILEKLESRKLKAMGKTKYVLAEFGQNIQTEEIEYCVDQLIQTGWLPIIAHVERYPRLFDSQDGVRLLHKKALFQINAFSIAEEKDKSIRLNAQWLLQERLADFLGSDTHGIEHRPPLWAKALEYIRKNCDEVYAGKILYKNAMGYFEINEKMDRLQDVLKDGMYGLAIGDALGVPYEFCSLEQMKASPCTDMEGYLQHNQPKGSWSDDTSMSLCITDSLCNGFDLNDIAKKFLLWKKQKQYTATGVLFDVGTQTRKALNRYEEGYPVDYCGSRSVDGNGNGGLMRCFPIAFYQCMKSQADEEHLQMFLEPIHDVSRITHGHEIGLICCGLYSLVLREYLQFSRDEDSLLDIIEKAYQKAHRTYTQMGGLFSKLINNPEYFPSPLDIMKRKPEELPSQGYVLNTWNITLWSLLNTSNYKDCVLKAINIGGDTDTNAAVAGSLAGVVYGRANIPSEWIEQLQNKRLIELLCDKLNLELFNKKKDIKLIDNFEGIYAFLSMKTPACITVGDYHYQNTTAAYYALGVNEEDRVQFEFLNNKQARKMYADLPHNDVSEEERLYLAVSARFQQNPKDAEKLLDTGKAEIIYDTTHDNLLGRCRCNQCKNVEYRNLYGRSLMKVREELRAQR